MLFKGQIFLSTQKRNINDLTFQKKKNQGNAFSKNTNQVNIKKE